MTAIDADLLIDSPVGQWRLAGQGQVLDLVVPREATLPSLWQSMKPLRRLSWEMVQRGSALGLLVRVRWRGRTVASLGGRSQRWGLVRPSLTGLFLSLAAPRHEA